MMRATSDQVISSFTEIGYTLTSRVDRESWLEFRNSPDFVSVILVERGIETGKPQIMVGLRNAAVFQKATVGLNHWMTTSDCRWWPFRKFDRPCLTTFFIHLAIKSLNLIDSSYLSDEPWDAQFEQIQDQILLPHIHSVKDLESLKVLFSRDDPPFDNCDDVLRCAELASAMKLLGHTPPEIESAIALQQPIPSGIGTDAARIKAFVECFGDVGLEQ